MAEGTTVGSISYDLDLDDSKFNKGIDEASKKVDSLGGRFKAAEAGSQMFAAGIAAVGAALGAFALKSVEAYNESEKTVAQLDAVLASTKGVMSQQDKTTTSTKLSAAATAKLSGELADANAHLHDMEARWNSTSTHTETAARSLEKARAEVAKLSGELGHAGDTVTSKFIAPTQLSRDALIDLSKALQQTTTFSDEAVLGAESLLLTFTNIGKKTFPEATQTVLDMSVALGQDLKSSSIQLGKALQDPILGVSALRRVGVNFSEDQQNVIKKLVETGHVLDAQKMILKELNTEFGGSAAAAAKTFSGQITILSNVFNDFQELVGEAIVKNLRPLVLAFNDWMSAIGGPQGMMRMLSATLQNIAPFIPTITGFIIGGLVPAFVALAASIWSAMAPLIPFLVVGAAFGFVIQELNSKFLLVSNSLPLVIGLIAALATGIVVVLVPAFIAWATGAGAAAIATAAVFAPVTLLIAGLGLLAGAAVWATQQTLLLTDAHYGAEMGARNLKVATDALKQANDDLAFAEENTISTAHRLEGAHLAVERAQLAYTEAVKAHGPKSLEAREAANRLETAQDGVKMATNNVHDAVIKEMEAQTKAIKQSDEVVAAAKPVKSAFEGIADAIGGAINNFLKWAGLKDKNGGSNGGQSYAEGGWVSHTGNALVHAGEYVLSRDMLDNLNSSLLDVVGGSKSSPTVSTGEPSTTSNMPINIYIDKVNDQQDVTAIGRELGFRAGLL